MNNELSTEIPLGFNLPKDKTENIIKVIGVGGGGGNAVTNMYKRGICNVAFAVCNTDSQALAKCEVPVRVQLGESGLGTGGHPEKESRMRKRTWLRLKSSSKMIPKWYSSRLVWVEVRALEPDL